MSSRPNAATTPNRGLPLPDSTPNEPLPRTGLIFGPDGPSAIWSLLIYAVLAVAFYSAAPYVVRALLPHHQPGTSAPAQTILQAGPVGISETVLFLFALLAAWIMSQLERRPFAAYGLGRTPRALPEFLNGLAWGITLLAVLISAIYATGLIAFDGLLEHGPAAIAKGALWLVIFFAVALFEEFFFRGYLQFTLARGLARLYAMGLSNSQSNALGFWTSAVLLSFGFGLIHTSNAGESPIGLSAAGLVGLVFCLSLWRTGSLWWAIGFHSTWDWAQSFLFGTGDSGALIEGRLAASHPVGTPLLSGGITGPEGSLYILPMLALIAAAILLTVRRTHAGYQPATPGLPDPVDSPLAHDPQ